MKNIQNNLFVGSLLLSVFAVMLFVTAPKADALEPNILIGPDLSIGSTGQNVVMLQGIVSELGYLNVPMGVPLGYYGSLTKNAVGRYQAELSVSPTAGYYGNITKNAVYSHLKSHDWLEPLDWE